MKCKICGAASKASLCRECESQAEKRALEIELSIVRKVKSLPGSWLSFAGFLSTEGCRVRRVW